MISYDQPRADSARSLAMLVAPRSNRPRVWMQGFPWYKEKYGHSHRQGTSRCILIMRHHSARREASVGPGAYIRASHRLKGVVCYLFFIDCLPRGAAVGGVIEVRRVMARAHPVQSGLVMKRSSKKKKQVRSLHPGQIRRVYPSSTKQERLRMELALRKP